MKVGYTDDFNIINKMENARLRQQDHDDLNNELRGTDVGRMSRFLSPEVRDLVKEERKGEKDLKDIIQQTLLDIMLMDDEYRQLYDGAMDRLRDLEEATQRALDKAEIELEKSREQLAETLDRAAMLDGVHVFKDAQGRVWTEHDERVKDTDAERIEWKGNEPDREEYHADRAHNHTSQKTVDDIRQYQTDTLGSARERLTDKDNPLRKDQLEGFVEDLDRGQPAAIRSELEASQIPISPNADRQADCEIEIPSTLKLSSDI